jgi:lipopolysaccharide transport system permease protein
MMARFSDVEVRVDGPGRRIEVSCRLENRDAEAWSAGAGYAFSYQIFDLATGTLVEDGRRAAFEQEVEPGSAVAARASVALPEQPGQYRVYVSPLVEHRAWFYQEGSPFLLIDARVEDGRARLDRQRVATLGRVNLETAMRTILRALWYPIRTLVKNRSLIGSLVRRDVAGRYRGSYAGLFWTVIHPVLMMATYYFVFGLVLRARFANDDRPSSFVLYFLAGMLPWLAISEALGRAPSVIVEHRTFVKKLVFPVEILPVNLAVAGLVSQGFALAIFAAGMWYFDRPFTGQMLYLPLLLIPQFLLTLGLCWFLAALGVFFRDVGHVTGFLLTLWFFVTPICYPETSLPEGWQQVFSRNPLYILVRAYRRILLEGSGPGWWAMAKLGVLAAAVCVAGHAWFYRLRRSFADLL